MRRLIASLMGWFMLACIIAMPVMIVHGLWVNDFSHLWRFIIGDIVLFIWCIFFAGTVLRVDKMEIDEEVNR